MIPGRNKQTVFHIRKERGTEREKERNEKLGVCAN
jgi:hypothetical protein